MPFQTKWQVLVFPAWMFSVSRDYSEHGAVYSGLAVIDICYWNLYFHSSLIFSSKAIHWNDSEGKVNLFSALEEVFSYD